MTSPGHMSRQEQCWSLWTDQASWMRVRGASTDLNYFRSSQQSPTVPCWFTKKLCKSSLNFSVSIWWRWPHHPTPRIRFPALLVLVKCSDLILQTLKCPSIIPLAAISGYCRGHPWLMLRSPKLNGRLDQIYKLIRPLPSFSNWFAGRAEGKINVPQTGHQSDTPRGTIKTSRLKYFPHCFLGPQELAAIVAIPLLPFEPISQMKR